MGRVVRHAAAICWGALAIASCGETPPDRAAPAAAPTAAPTDPAHAGVPRDWVPQQRLTTSLVVTEPGAVVEDVLLENADLVVDAPDVTIRRVKLQGGRIHNIPGSTCRNGMVVEDSTIEPAPGRSFSRDSEGVVGYGGYIARRVKIWRRGEGFRVGGRSAGCGPVRIEDSFAKIAVAPGCPGDPHSDGIQGYDGPALSVRNVTIDFREASCGTAPVFLPDSAGNTTASIDGMLVMGGGFTFRSGVPGSVRDLKIVDRSWSYAPVDVDCSLMRGWDAEIVTIDARYRVTRTLQRQPCE
jgi:hypothetical protein